MSNALNGEEVIRSIVTHKVVKNSSLVGSVIANLVSHGVAGRITNDFKLSLTA